MTDKPRAYSQMFLGIDRAKSGSDKTVYWRQDDGEDRQTATEVHRRTAQSWQDDPGDAWGRLSQAFDTGQIYTPSQAHAAVPIAWSKACDPDTWSEPPLPREDPRLGEIVGWRAWRVGSHWKNGHPQHGSVSCLMSLVRDTKWRPDEPMTGEPSDDGRDGVNAFKTRRDLMTSSVVAFSMVGEAYVIGQVALWGDVIEHEHGWRAQFGAVHSLDAVIGFTDSGRSAVLVVELRRRYISP